MVSEHIEEFPLTISFAKTLMNNFFIRSKLTRDSIIYQSLLYLTYVIRAMKMKTFLEDNPDHPITKGKITVGIIGAGLMGKTLFELLHKRTLFGRFRGLTLEVTIEAEISTRVPEKLSIEMGSEIQAYYDNKKLFSRADVVFICVPKHKLKNVFNDIRADYLHQMMTKNVVFWLKSEKICNISCKQPSPKEDSLHDGHE
jgi:hypothetical protein